MSPSLLRTAVFVAAIASAMVGQTLPSLPVPPENPITPEKTILGKILFWEEQLSDDNTVACGTCHRPEAGGGDPRTASAQSVNPGPDLVFGTSDDIQGSISVVRCDPGGYFFDDGVFWPNPFVIKRKAQGFIGHQWDPEMFWDGRGGGVFIDQTTSQVLIPAGGSLEHQAALVPPSGTMGCQGRTWADIVQKLQVARPMRLATNLTPDIQSALAAHPTYPALFASAFGDPAVTRERAAFAIATYERTLLPDQTPYDAYLQGQTSALTPAQVHGLQVFASKGCAQCHTPPLFTNSGYHNIGVRPPGDDMGRTIATGQLSDRGKFKVPTLRNVVLRAPYFHNGKTATLNDVVLFYERGGDFTENLDPLMVPFALTAQERADLVDFLANALLDPRVAQALPPFDRPTLYSELAPNPARYGTGSTGSGGFTPQMVAPIPPVIGANRFALGVAHGVGGAPAILALALAPAPSGTMLGNLPIWIAIDPLPLFLPTSLLGPTGVPGTGYGSIITPISENPAISGATLYAQWALADPGAPLGISVSDAASFVFFAP